MVELKIWVGNLGKYNEGELVGDWFTLPVEVKEIMETIGVADGTEYEEYIILDSECSLGEIVHIGPYSNIETLNDIADELYLLSDIQSRILEELIMAGVLSRSPADLIDHIIRIRSGNDYRIKEAKSLAKIAEDYAVDAGHIAEDHPLFSYVDFEVYAESLGLGTSHYLVAKDTWVEWLD